MSRPTGGLTEERETYLLAHLREYALNPAALDALTVDEYEFIVSILTPEIIEKYRIEVEAELARAAPATETVTGGIVEEPAPTAPEGAAVSPDATVPLTETAPAPVSAGFTAPPVEVPSLPWYASWLSPVIDYIQSLANSVVNYVVPAANSIVLSVDIGASIWNSLIDKMGALFTKTANESISKSLEAITDATGHSPEYKIEIDSKIRSFSNGLIDDALKQVAPTTLGHSALEPEAAKDALNIAGGVGIGVFTAATVAGIAAEASTLGQLDGLFNVTHDILNNLGLGELTKAMVTYPLEPLVLTPARYYWNSQFTPFIPSTVDLINMVVKEKLSIADFKKNMAFNGISGEWSDKIWDAHFVAPSLGQLLVSWRRNHITTDDLEKYQILVDLDPTYKVFWEDMRFVDPSITEARYMFESGVIDADGVKDIIRRNGLFPADVDRLTDFVTRFQERLFRRRIILTVANGYRLGVFNVDRVREAVKDAGYTDGVAAWVIRNEDYKREIAEAKIKPQREVLMTLTLVKDAFIHGDIDDAYLMSYFQEKGYDPFEVSVAVKSFIRERDKFLVKGGLA